MEENNLHSNRMQTTIEHSEPFFVLRIRVQPISRHGNAFPRAPSGGRLQASIIPGGRAERGPGLGYPHSSGVAGSRHSYMRELRVQHQGRPYRVFYAFDPRRSAILLIAGDKTGDDRFYVRMVPIADGLYDRHLEQLRREG